MKAKCHREGCRPSATNASLAVANDAARSRANSSAWSGYTTKGEDKVGAQSQGSPNEGELAGEEIVKPERPCKANTSDVVGINPRNKICMNARKNSAR